MGEEHVRVPVMEEHTLTCPFVMLSQEASEHSLAVVLEMVA